MGLLKEEKQDWLLVISTKSKESTSMKRTVWSLNSQPYLILSLVISHAWFMQGLGVDYAFLNGD